MAKNRPAKKDNNKEKKGKKEKGVGKRMKKEAMIQAIISVFQSSPKEPFNYKQISKIIGVENQVQKLQVVDILYDLSAEDIITEIDRGHSTIRTIALSPFLPPFSLSLGMKISFANVLFSVIKKAKPLAT